MSNDEGRTICLHLPSRLGFERVAMEAAGSAAKLIGFHRSRMDDLRTAVSEACINAMEHAHKLNAEMAVIVALRVGDESLQVDVADQGGGVPDRIDEPDIRRQFAGEQDVRGWGIFLIRSLMDDVQFNVESDLGNVTRMVIRLAPPSDDDAQPSAQPA